MYIEDGSSALARAILEDQNLDTSHLRDVEGNPITSRMPKRGEVDLFCAGFPCPGYSGLNLNPSFNDIKNTLICLVISYIDFYRPRYVLLENVIGLLRHGLGATQEGKKLLGGILKGTLKQVTLLVRSLVLVYFNILLTFKRFILRSLTSLGYAVQVIPLPYYS